MSSIDFEIVNKTICLCARRASGKSVLLKYIINKININLIQCF